MIMDCGIYTIQNELNGKQYIGSSVGINRRFRNHRRTLEKGVHHAPHLQNAWNRYGEAAFSFRPLVICSRRDLLMYEQLLLDNLHPEYNVARFAGASTRGTKLSEITRSRIGDKMRGRKWSSETLRKMSIAAQGRTMPEEQRKKISEALKGRARPEEVRQRIGHAHKGRKFSEEHRQKLSKAHSGKALTAHHRLAILRGKGLL